MIITPFPRKSFSQLYFSGYILVCELQIFCQLFLNPESKFQVTPFFKNLLVTHLSILLFLKECRQNFLLGQADEYQYCCCDQLSLSDDADSASVSSQQLYLQMICNSKTSLVLYVRLLNLFDLLSFVHTLFNQNLKTEARLISTFIDYFQAYDGHQILSFRFKQAKNFSKFTVVLIHQYLFLFFHQNYLSIHCSFNNQPYYHSQQISEHWKGDLTFR